QNQRLEDFASVVSHDLRNPLNVAEGYTEMAIEENETGDYEYMEEYLRTIRESHQRMEEMIQDVMTLANQGERVEEAETEEVVVGEVVEEAWGNVDTRNGELDNRAKCIVNADRNRLLQMFENLFRNAIEHGGNDTTVRVGTTSRGFYVEDDGEGIPPEERERVLERGYTTSEDGTGLGLSIIKTIVDAHGWEFGLDESDEGGARFEITGVGMEEKGRKANERMERSQKGHDEEMEEEIIKRSD
ncbi:MAG: HAMP domain-containing sensor histidine kinase, partial [Halobacteria archaeon]|nr:HAMP domain-containing sensor histidine kinase [Halobacteria archaeon]